MTTYNIVIIFIYILNYINIELRVKLSYVYYIFSMKMWNNKILVPSLSGDLILPLTAVRDLCTMSVVK